MSDAGLEELETWLKVYVDHYTLVIKGLNGYRCERTAEQDPVVVNYRDVCFSILTKVHELRAKYNKDLTDVSDNTYINY